MELKLLPLLLGILDFAGKDCVVHVHLKCRHISSLLKFRVYIIFFASRDLRYTYKDMLQQTRAHVRVCVRLRARACVCVKDLHRILIVMTSKVCT